VANGDVRLEFGLINAVQNAEFVKLKVLFGLGMRVQNPLSFENRP
jgi:hypothetical protein